MTDQIPKLHIREKIGKERFYIDNKVVDQEYVAFLGKGFNLYVTLARYSNFETQKSFPSYETLMRKSGIRNRNKISEVIKTLESLNMIRIKKISRRGPNNYYLIDKSHWKLPSSITPDTTREVSKQSGEQYQKPHLSSITSDTGNEQRKRTKEMNSFSHKEFNEKKKALGENMRIKGA